MKHLNQTCGSSCGPTSLKMIMSVVGYREDLGIQDIFSMAPTKIGGTPWPRMSQIIRKLGIKHRVMAEVPLSYFMTAPKDKVWMLAVYCGNIKHWVVLNGYKNGIYTVFDPADTIIEYTKQELYNIFDNRNSLVIEFDLNDFLGESEVYDVFDRNGDYVMKYVDKNQMRLIEDSNYLFGKTGKKVESVDEIYTDEIEDDYIYGIFNHDEIFYNKYIFAVSEDKVILLRYKS
jgi:hypothetical protein